MLFGRRLAFLFLILAMHLGRPAFAQSSSAIPSTQTGELHLQVKDPSGRALRARGRLNGPVAGGSREVRTDVDGSLVLSNLPFGNYRLQLSQSGFTAGTIEFQVHSATPVNREVTLNLGGVSTTVDVIASTPIGSLDISVDDVPVPVQTVTSRTIEDTNAIDLTDVLKKRMNGVYVNENQNNPFQPDVNYRGYTASPLVGSPAGLSVYLDGVRQNQPFGDVVAWDLIPKVAISATELIRDRILSMVLIRWVEQSQCRQRTASRTLGSRSALTAAASVDAPSMRSMAAVITPG